MERLRSAVAQHLNSHQATKILGTQLGALINGVLSPDNYKSWLDGNRPNLRSFVDNFLSGIVTPTSERQGYDYLYQVDFQPITPSFGGALWKAFCATRPTETIYFNPKQNTLFLLGTGIDVDVDAQVIQGLSEQDHRQMCERFLALLERDGKSTQQIASTVENFDTSLYAAWASSLKAVPGLFKEWGIQRVSWIVEIFSNRVNDVTTDEATRARLVAEFQADHASQRQGVERAGLKVPSAIAPTPHANSSAEGARQLLLRALETLDDSQLSKIMVPMDVVVTLLTQPKL
ncbi:hypothetical protein DCO48_21355 [Pseudomonas sp. SDI]|nr:hypothetical protein DCO48_21355 [Pseudomonas sp. SDI]